MNQDSKLVFFLKNLLKGLAYMAVLAVAYYFLKNYLISSDKYQWLKDFYEKPLAIYLIYIGSEVFFGLFPPELFMVWALYKGDQLHYWLHVLFFTAISYGAGVLSFFIGYYFRRVVLFRYLSMRFFAKYWPLFRKYGSILIVTAALTPLPWATISILVGSSSYPFKKFLWVALSRVFRFLVYGYLVYMTRVF